MGRPATGRTTKTLGVRLPLEKVAELERRATKLGLAPTAWAAQVLERELKFPTFGTLEHGGYLSRS